MFQLIGTGVAGGAHRKLNLWFARVACFVWAVAIAPPLHAAPNNDTAHEPAKLVDWQTPEVAGGAVAPTVVLRLLVGADGAVKQAEVSKKRDGIELAEQQALDAARKFRFEPAKQNGKAVDSWVVLTLPMRATSAGEHKIVVRGSDTMGEALLPAWAQALERGRGKDKLSLQIEALGSSTGFAGLLDGTADLAASSRVINPEEISFAQKLGVQLHEIFVGLDGIAIVVNPQSPLHDLDTATAAAIFAGRITNWRELGGDDAPIRVIGRPAYSGTHAFVRQRLLSQLGADTEFGPDVKTVEKTEQLADAVAQDAHSIGYVGLAYVKPGVRALALRSRKDGPAIVPSADSVLNGTYPIARPLLLYMRTDSPRGTREVVDFALSTAGQALVKKHGFVPMPAGYAESFVALMPAPAVPAPEVLRIYFDANSSNISHESNMDVMQAAMAVHANRRVLIIGNADASGKAEDNRKLAKQRADVVAARLRALAKRDAAIEVEVAATEHPLATNTTIDGRQANRRVDVLVFGKPAAMRRPTTPATRPTGDNQGVGASNKPRETCEPGSGRRCLY
jgi:phosphate transport system substrate-binding protein